MYKTELPYNACWNLLPPTGLEWNSIADYFMSFWGERAPIKTKPLMLHQLLDLGWPPLTLHLTPVQVELKYICIP